MELKTIFAKTNHGPYLQVNEDLYDFDLNTELFMVFDAFGGVNKGDICAEELRDAIKHFYQSRVKDPDSTLPYYYSPKYLLEGNVLINSALEAHKKIQDKNSTLTYSKRSGSSAILMVRSENTLTFLSTGNCRSYLVRSGEIRPLFLEDTGEGKTEGSYSIPFSGFGLFPSLHFQVKEVTPKADDLYLILTDGVYSRLTEREILSTVMMGTSTLEERIESLFAQANSKGNLDNQTCMIFEY